MKKLLVVVDMQNDFVTGVLGTKEAQAIVLPLCEKISNWDGDIAITLDTHTDDYMSTVEGEKLPVMHCIRHSDGWKLVSSVEMALAGRAKVFEKPTFGSVELAQYIKNEAYEYIEFTGVCTDICVISNVLLTKANVPNAVIKVDASCCAGVTQDSHNNALSAMAACHIDIE